MKDKDWTILCSPLPDYVIVSKSLTKDEAIRSMNEFKENSPKHFFILFPSRLENGEPIWYVLQKKGY